MRAARGCAFVCSCSMLLALAAAANAETFYGPTPYLSQADSPLLNSGTTFTNFQLEDFEDEVFDMDGVSITKGWVVPGVPLMDSVDGDDGNINGLSQGGKSLFSNHVSNNLEITFDANVLGSLPTHAGLVWTDVGFVAGNPVYKGDVIFEAWGPGGVYLGGTAPAMLGDGQFTGQTLEDRFFGVSNLAGISKIRLTMPLSDDFEVDHIQFGIAAVPAPGSVGLVALAGAMAARRRRR